MSLISLPSFLHPYFSLLVIRSWILHWLIFFPLLLYIADYLFLDFYLHFSFLPEIVQTLILSVITCYDYELRANLLLLDFEYFFLASTECVISVLFCSYSPFVGLFCRTWVKKFDLHFDQTPWALPRFNLQLYLLRCPRLTALLLWNGTWYFKIIIWTASLPMA